MDLPNEMICGSEDDVIKWAFCDDEGNMKPFEEIEHTAILTPHNDTSLEINEKVFFHFTFVAFADLEQSERS